MPLKTKAFSLLILLVAVNVFLWLLAWVCSQRYTLLLSAGLLAYGFGLRHAVDADHISAIDNTTRKLMQDGKRPLGVGFFFSLGHSTVVILLCLGLALSTAYVQSHLPQWKTVGSLLGTLVSSTFLYVIGIINLIILIDLYKTWKRTARGASAGMGAEMAAGKDSLLNGGGLLARLFRPWLRMIRHSWQMYFVGFLFGLGFDTATEVGILTLSARSGQRGIPLGIVLLLPLLFTAGMCLIDTLDGILMLGAYGWAFIEPIRKLYYNLGITVLSVLVAFVVGTYELLQILQQRLGMQGRFWTFLAGFSFENAGFVIVGLFAAGWCLAALLFQNSQKAQQSP